MMPGYIWRAADIPTQGQGRRANAPDADVIEFTSTTISDGKYIRSTEVNFTPGFAENERPNGFNQIQDTGLNIVEYTIIGHAQNPKGNDITNIVKRWLIEPKATVVYPKGRFGIELDVVGGYDVVPTALGVILPTRPEQARGLFLTEWRWMHSAEWPGKLDFTAVFRFNGDYGSTGTATDYDWTVIHP